ncbi:MULTISPECIES: SDR family oxidoreductase [unclassified Frigoribacterium]|uniref:SDR family oxidoreductase n=1 Tax=unclassified Frigoribacterium TaxID=2627005 RepID=UPI0006FD6F0C|nr:MULTISPECIES: SDR family oxidoreductase [unclassified Frigoribacterium]KQO48183.1 NAD(P)-dependent oxidoreductase [Frigoribacterium sp. Leaf254]KQT40277.1 NAD(P)-dependent oxidoreductase [Frigoribacterium sp. Leaf415]
MTDSPETSSASVGEPARASSPLVAVTGATGAVGGIVALHLSERGVPLRLVVRDAARAPRLDGAEAEVAVATYGDRAASVEALRGVETLFMVSAAEAPDRVDQHRTFVDAAVEAGVRHVVYTSFAGASADSVFTLGRDHFATEQHIRESGLAFTFLRDNFYLDFIPLFADEQGVIRGPAGDGRVAAVARADVAAVAAVVLLDHESHAGATYDLTGSEAFTLTEAAARLTALGGRSFTFVDETVDEAYESRRVFEPEPFQADAWVSTYTSMASGEVAQVTSSVRDLTGRDPLTLEVLFAGGVQD